MSHWRAVNRRHCSIGRSTLEVFEVFDKSWKVIGKIQNFRIETFKIWTSNNLDPCFQETDPHSRSSPTSGTACEIEKVRGLSKKRCRRVQLSRQCYIGCTWHSLKFSLGWIRQIESWEWECEWGALFGPFKLIEFDLLGYGGDSIERTC